MTDPLLPALQFIAAEFAPTRDRALQALAPNGDQLLDGLVARGDVRRHDGWYTVAPPGNRRLADAWTDDGVDFENPRHAGG